MTTNAGRLQQRGNLLTPNQVSGLQLWLKADAIGSLVDADPVATWADSSGNARDATQATGTKQPAYKTAIQNGLPVVRFDGTTDYLEVVYAAALNPAAFTLITVARPTGGAGAYRAVLSNRNTSFRGHILYASVTNVWESWAGTGAAWGSALGVAATLSTAAVVTGQYDAAASRVWVRGLSGSKVTGAYSVNPSAPIRVGAGQNETTPNFYFSGDLCEIALYDVALSSAERCAVERGLSVKWAATVA